MIRRQAIVLAEYAWRKCFEWEEIAVSVEDGGGRECCYRPQVRQTAELLWYQLAGRGSRARRCSLQREVLSAPLPDSALA